MAKDDENIYEDLDFSFVPDPIEYLMPAVSLFDWIDIGYHCLLMVMDEGVRIRAPQEAAQILWEAFWAAGVRCRGRVIIPLTYDWEFFAETTAAHAHFIINQINGRLAGSQDELRGIPGGK